ncbi:reverse transcriptase domain-containing protein [Kibdelosporangium aridum]|uniref:reverse transcriptase domain-containing protein n=1 Tax=Kibdelosporangium aridum TaxID=2030 RepID=UPI00406BB2CD
MRRAHDTVAEVRVYAMHSYEWIVEGDIKACFDEIAHPALLVRVRERVGDKRVVALVKAFLKAGILGEDRRFRENNTGTPQGSILSPLLSNVALSVLDEYIAHAPGGAATGTADRAKRRRHGLPNFKLVRFADDWCLMVSGSKTDAQALREEIAEVLSTMGLRLSQEKTLITHIDEGLDFLGWRIQRHRKRGSDRRYVYTYSARKAVKAVTGKVKTICRTTDTNLPLDALLSRLNPALRGLVRLFPPRSVHRRLQLPGLLYMATGRPMAPSQTPPVSMERPAPPLLQRRRMVASLGRETTVQPGESRHNPLPLPGNRDPNSLAVHEMRNHQPPYGTCGAPGAWRQARRVREAARGNGPVDKTATAPRADFTIAAQSPSNASTCSSCSRSPPATSTSSAPQHIPTDHGPPNKPATY